MPWVALLIMGQLLFLGLSIRERRAVPIGRKITARETGNTVSGAGRPLIFWPEQPGSRLNDTPRNGALPPKRAKATTRLRDDTPANRGRPQAASAFGF